MHRNLVLGAIVLSHFSALERRLADCQQELQGSVNAHNMGGKNRMKILQPGLPARFRNPNLLSCKATARTVTLNRLWPAGRERAGGIRHFGPAAFKVRPSGSLAGNFKKPKSNHRSCSGSP